MYYKDIPLLLRIMSLKAGHTIKERMRIEHEIKLDLYSMQCDNGIYSCRYEYNKNKDIVSVDQTELNKEYKNENIKKIDKILSTLDGKPNLTFYNDTYHCNTVIVVKHNYPKTKIKTNNIVVTLNMLCKDYFDCDLIKHDKVLNVDGKKIILLLMIITLLIQYC